MKITKTILKQLIKEELENILNENSLAGPTRTGKPAKQQATKPSADNPLAGPTTAGEPAKQQATKPSADNPLAGPTTAGEPQQIQKKAVALDKVEALLTKLVKQLQQL